MRALHGARGINHPECSNMEVVMDGDQDHERELFVEGWEFMQTLGEGAYGE